MKIKLNEFKEYLVKTHKAKNTIEKYTSDIYKMYEYISRGELSAGAPSGVTSSIKNCRGELASPSINKEIIIKYKE